MSVVRPRFTEKRFRPYVIAIGESTLSWNDLHEALLQVFYGIASGIGVYMSGEMWNALANDRAKREVLKAAAACFKNRKAAADIKWILERCQELEDDRNNAIHAPLWAPYVKDTDAREVQANSSTGNRRASRLEGKNILKEYRRLRDAAILLGDFCYAIAAVLFEDEIGFSEHSPWPDRPRLPDRGGPKISR